MKENKMNKLKWNKRTLLSSLDLVSIYVFSFEMYNIEQEKIGFWQLIHSLSLYI